ncbi:hypothetical protein O988_06404 [Pseudogymnoascus sp. VKM F-3808]|nr:hypothetical protein O988_06404 [Pseudogymnoascus sp. VKM F-3808]
MKQTLITTLFLATLVSSTLVAEREIASIDKLFKAKGKLYFGSITDPVDITNSQDANTIIADFGAVSPENSMKWDATEPSRVNFNFNGANQFNHVSTVAGRYASKIYAWDVVNEIFNEDGSLRDSVFSRVLGDKFVSIAFNAARKADSHAKLYINDYNLDSIAAGVPIDGIGSQSHLGQGGSSGTLGALQAMSKIVSEVAITELDIVNAPADDYVSVTNACLQISNCVGITTWGTSDAHSWQSSDHPLLFDGNYQPKAAYNAVVSLLSSGSTDPGTTTTASPPTNTGSTGSEAKGGPEEQHVVRDLANTATLGIASVYKLRGRAGTLLALGGLPQTRWHGGQRRVSRRQHRGDFMELVRQHLVPDMARGGAEAVCYVQHPATQEAAIIIASLTEEGKLRILVDSVWEMEDLVKAYAWIGKKRAKGKVVIKVEQVLIEFN